MEATVDQGSVSAPPPQTLPAGPNLNLFTVGMTGHGKTSTVNSIVGNEVCHVGDGIAMAKGGYHVSSADVDGRSIRVTDTPGVLEDSPAFENEMFNVVKNELNLSTNGINALLLVLPYKPKIASSDLQAVKTLKRVFGEDAVKKHTVIIFTRGDIFNDDTNNNYEGNFLRWIKNQDKEMFDIGVENRLRCVLFDNITRTEEVKKSQLIELVTTIDGLRQRPTKYSIDDLQIPMDQEMGMMIGERLRYEVNSLDELCADMASLDAKDFPSFEMSQIRSRVASGQMIFNLAGCGQQPDIQKAFARCSANLVAIDNKAYHRKITEPVSVVCRSTITALNNLNAKIQEDAKKASDKRKNTFKHQLEMAKEYAKVTQEERMEEKRALLNDANNKLFFVKAQSNKMCELLDSVLQSIRKRKREELITTESSWSDESSFPGDQEGDYDDESNEKSNDLDEIPTSEVDSCIDEIGVNIKPSGDENGVSILHTVTDSVVSILQRLLTQ